MGIIILIVAIAILFGGVFAWRYFLVKPIPTPQMPTNQTAGWKTYTNTDYGFEIKYPSYFNLGQTGRPDLGVKLINNKKDLNISWLALGLNSGIKGDILYDDATAGISVDNNLDNGGIIKIWDSSNKNITSKTYETVGAPSRMPSIETIIKYGNSSITLTLYGKKETNLQKIKTNDFSDYTDLESISNQVLSTFKFITPEKDQYGNLIPKIDSISSTSGPKGAVVEVKGSGLSGFEGDLDIYFERTDGKKIILTDTSGNYTKTQDKLIKVEVVEPCQSGEKMIGRYSGIESVCDYVELTPGMYKVYVNPWGTKSNIVNFEITR